MSIFLFYRISDPRSRIVVRRSYIIEFLIFEDFLVHLIRLMLCALFYFSFGIFHLHTIHENFRILLFFLIFSFLFFSFLSFYEFFFSSSLFFQTDYELSDGSEFRLGKWLDNQRQKQRDNTLLSDRAALLQTLVDDGR